MQRRTFLAALVLPAAAAACAPSATSGGSVATQPEPTEIVMAFTPSSDPNALLTRATPITEYLSKESGLKIKPFITTDYTATIEAMTSKKVDVAWLAPTAYVLAKDQNDAEVVYKALRKNATTGNLDDFYTSTIIIPTNSSVTKLSDLKGKRVAFVDPTSTSGYIYPVALLLKNGIDAKKDLTATFAGGHDAAALAVYQGNADAAATFDGAAEQLLKERFPDVSSKLKTLASTDPIPNDVIAFRKDLAPGAKEKLKTALKKMASDPAAVGKDSSGKETRLLAIYRWDGVTDAKDSDFDAIRNVARGLGIPLKELAPK